MKAKANNNRKEKENMEPPRTGPEAVKAMKQTEEALVLA